jgi:hypothetical protein
MVHEVSGVDASPFIVLAIRNHSAKPEDASISINEEAIVRKIGILGIVHSVSKFHSSEVADKQSVIPFQEQFLRIFSHQLLIGLEKFPVNFSLQTQIHPNLLPRKPIVSQLVVHPFLKTFVAKSFLVNVSADSVSKDG